MSNSKKKKKGTGMMKTIRRLWDYMKKYKGALIFVVISVLITTGLNLAIPYLIGISIDQFIGTGNLDGLMTVVIIFMVIALLLAFFQRSQAYIMGKVAQKTTRDLRLDAFTYLQKLPVKYFDSNPRGIIMSKLTNDIDLVSQTLSNSLVQMISSVFILIGAVIVMFATNWLLAIITLLIIPTILIVTKLVSKRTLKAFADQQTYLADVNTIVEESINGQLAVQLYSQQDRVIGEFSEANNKLKEAGTRAQFYSGILMSIMTFLNNVSYALIICVGAVLVVLGNNGVEIIGMGAVTIGMIASFANYAKQFSQPLNQLAQLFNTIQSAVSGAERVFDLMDEKTEYETGIAERPVETLKGDVRFDHVDFGYDADRMILKDLTFDVKAGETIAIVGPTGSGKTTIINLLNRFYDANKGNVYLDNTNIVNMEKESLRHKVGVVLQDTYLFTGTVKENIKYGKLNATDEEVIKAAKLANAHDFVSHLADGYDTFLPDGGNNLSQGQRQLLTIARTILSDPNILILDEATSNIDTRTEAKIQESMDFLMSDRTSFVIAHRLQTIKNATKILVLQDGRIIEYGNHNDLLANKGFYYDLYTTQFKTDKL